MHDSRLAASASTGPRIYLELTRQKLSRARRVKNYHVKQPAGPWLAEGSPFEPRYLFRFPRFFLFPRLSPPSLAPLSFAAGQFSPTKVAIRARVRVRVLRLVSARRWREGRGRCCIAIASVKAASANKPTPPSSPPFVSFALSFQRSGLRLSADGVAAIGEKKYFVKSG